jgi:hypothetical protein
VNTGDKREIGASIHPFVDYHFDVWLIAREPMILGGFEGFD